MKKAGHSQKEISVILDVSRIESLGWRPKVNFEDGVIKVYLDYLDSINT